MLFGDEIFNMCLAYIRLLSKIFIELMDVVWLLFEFCAMIVLFLIYEFNYIWT